MTRPTFYPKSDNQFEQECEFLQARIDALNSEIIRLKIKCGEEIKSDEILRGFGNMPTSMDCRKSARIKAGVISA